MKELELSVQEIRELMEAFRQGDLGSLKLRQGDFCLELEGRKVEQVFAAAPHPAAPPIAAAAAEPEAPVHSGHAVTSPIVGTFYAASAPDRDPYVRVGSPVKKGDVLFIIESMKLMNEVISDVDGVVTEIAVENGQGVEYGQTVLYIG